MRLCAALAIDVELSNSRKFALCIQASETDALLPTDDCLTLSQLNELRRHLKETLKPADEILAEAPPSEKKASAADGNGGPPAAKFGPSEEELAAAKVYPFYIANKPVSCRKGREAVHCGWTSIGGTQGTVRQLR